MCVTANADKHFSYMLIAEGLECASYVHIHIHKVLEDDASTGLIKRTACCSQLFGCDRKE